jgi:zinc/manganese transport system substrate-binding protein
MPARSLRRLAALAAATVLAGTVLVACGDDAGGGAATGDALAVVATTSILGDFANEIGGDRVAVDVILEPNVDAHDYEPAPSDIEAIRSADVVLRNGAGLESWFDDTIEASGTSATIVDTSTGVTLHEGGHHHDDDHHDEDAGHGDADGDEVDPHIWHDPRNAMLMVANVQAAFAAADPEGAATYQRNLDRYGGELEQLDADIAAEIAPLPSKKLVTNHDAFGYYADRYGFEIVGSVIPSFDTSAELSAADLDELIAAIRAEGVKAVFSETSLPGDAARTIAEEAGVAVVVGEDALYGDSLGPEGSDGATYLDMMRHNTDTIVANLQ